MCSMFEALEERYEQHADESPEEQRMRPRGKRPPVQLASVTGCGIAQTRAHSEELAAKYPAITQLDLSSNALAAWDEALVPAHVLPSLTSLDLSSNPLPMPPSISGTLPPPVSLRVLALNHCQMHWSDVVALAAVVPHLHELSLVGNSIDKVVDESHHSAMLMMNDLHVLNVDGNAIATWDDLARIATFAPNLTQLLASGNRLADSLPQRPMSAKVVDLAIAGNAIASWDTIAALGSAFPALRSLRVVGNPVLTGVPPLAARIKVLSLLPLLDSLNGSVVRPAERQEASRLLEQQQQHQTVSTAHSATATTTSGFILVTIQCNAASGSKQGSVQQRLPGSMSIRDLRQLCQRLFGVAAAQQALFFRERQADTVGAFPQPMDNDSHELRMYCGTIGGVVVIEDIPRS